jgi:hypothetical protein
VILRTTVLGGDDAPLAVSVNHDPTSTATDCPAGSLIIVVAGSLLPPAGVLNNWYRKLTSGSNTDVQLVSNMNLQGVAGVASPGESVKFVGGTGDVGFDGGNALFDGGALGAGGLDGIARLGTSFARKVEIGRTAKLTEFLGEKAYPQESLTLVASPAFNADVNITASAGPNLGKIYYLITGPAGAFSLSGFADTTDGRVIAVQNQSALTWTIKNEDTVNELTADRRILTLYGTDLVLPGPSIAWFIYDKTAARWIVTGVQSGSGMGSGGAILQWSATQVGAGTRSLRSWQGTLGADTVETHLNQILVPGQPSRLIKNAHVSIKVAPGAGQDITFEIYDDGVATGIIIVVSGALLIGSDLVNTHVAMSGSKLTVRVLRSVGSTPPDDTLFAVEAA